MSEANWQPGVCNERSGFLFSHECGEAGAFKCFRCTRPVCHAHAHQSTAGTICTTCAKQEMGQQPAAQPGQGQPGQGQPGQGQPGPGQQRPYAPYPSMAGTQGVYHGYNPYFYGGYYYPGYGYYGPGYWGHTTYHTYHHHHHHPRGHDPHDFTEGDAGAFANEADNDFEQGFGDS